MEMYWVEIVQPTIADNISVTFSNDNYVAEILIGWNRSLLCHSINTIATGIV